MKSLSSIFRRKTGALPEEASVTHEITDAGETDFAPQMVRPAAGKTSEKEPSSDDMVFELGDFLKRIPVKLLKHGEHDPTRPLHFPVSQISAMISQGKTMIA